MKSELICQIAKERTELLKCKNSIGSRLKNAPPGSLYARFVRDKYYQFYFKNAGDKERYMRKAEGDLIQQLAQKEYDRDLLSIINRRIAIVDELLEEYEGRTLIDPLKEICEGKRKLIHPEVCDDNEFVEKWMNKYVADKNPYEKELVLMTEKGEYVRSKSEKIIADKLYSKRIPYIYEPSLILPNGHMLFPDFAVLNVELRKEYYFEHFGMMDNPEYSAGAIKKIGEYEKNGYYFGKNLLYTFEVREQPIDIRMLDELIGEYLM